LSLFCVVCPWLQLGLHGLCQSHYAVEEEADTEMIITQVVDLNNCRERAELFTGMAMAVPDPVATEVMSNSLSITCSAFFLNVCAFHTPPTDT